MIELTPLTHAHLPYFFEWVNDEEAIAHAIFAFHNISSEKEITRWFAETMADPDCLNLAIIDTENGQCLGYAGLSDLNFEHGTGEYFIFIGDKDSWNKGIGTEVTKMVVEKGFEELNLESIILTVSDQNPGGRIAYERAGFTIDGCHLQSGGSSGQFHNQIVMSIRRDSYLAA
ncbi:GNAT family N-acetyltransferase [Rufibacter roseus]|uniref:GNAT family N-acetyltransferase n=1 Tax=Rufibacter roseus TaxID=1567108 RepID=A0ABW2DHB3_9BACT|nr:GNAT family protein [Rufibacter roseus]